MSEFLGPQLIEIVLLTLRVSLSATLIATLLGLPLGAMIATASRPAQSIAVPVINAFMGLPPVVVGLVVYLMLSRQGPLGSLGILFTPLAMIIAQAALIVPIVAALTRNQLHSFIAEHALHLRSMGAGRARVLAVALFQCRFALTTVALAGAGRAFAEVGTVMIVGGNIDGFTRVLTTTIATETSKGDVRVALTLGMTLIALIVVLNFAAALVRLYAARRYEA